MGNEIRANSMAYTAHLRKKRLLTDTWNKKAKTMVYKEREKIDKKGSDLSDDEHEDMLTDQDKIKEFVQIMISKPMIKKKNDKTKVNKTTKELDIANMPVLKLSEQTIKME